MNYEEDNRLFSADPQERNIEAIRLLDSGQLDQDDIFSAIIKCVLDDGGPKAQVGTLIWALWESGKWDEKHGRSLLSILAVCGNYEVRNHCMSLLGWITSPTEEDFKND